MSVHYKRWSQPWHCTHPDDFSYFSMLRSSCILYMHCYMGWRRFRCWPSTGSQVGRLLWKTVSDTTPHCVNQAQNSFHHATFLIESIHVDVFQTPGPDCITVAFIRHSSCEAKIWHFAMKAVLREVIPFTQVFLDFFLENKPHQGLTARDCCPRQRQTCSVMLNG